MFETISHQPRWMRLFGIFWRVIVLAAFGLGVYDAIHGDPTLLSSWRGILMALLIGMFLVVYERSEIRRAGHWPMPYRTVLLYLIVQLAIMIALVHFSRGFAGPIFALMGQVVSSIPIRRWPIPLAATMVTAGAAAGLIDSIGAANWGDIVGFLFSMTLWIGLAIFISALFHERHQRECLIGELRKAKDELERYALQAEELAALRERAPGSRNARQPWARAGCGQRQA
jgi:hypothetical protein